MKRLLFGGIFLLSLFNSAQAQPIRKILVLIIASDEVPVYRELQKLWRSYMHLDKEHIEAYFIKGDATLPSDYMIEGDIIWSKTEENFIPGIIAKTLISIEAFLPQLDNYDFIVRTNLSSFYIFPRLLSFLETCPTTNFYGGSPFPGAPTIACGCGFIISTDIARLLVANKEYLIQDCRACDDAVLGFFLNDQGYNAVIHERVDFTTIRAWRNGKNRIPETAFHFRLKNPASFRNTHELYIYKQLIAQFYGEKVQHLSS